MSYSLDVNILLYASDSSSPHHKRARQFLNECAEHGDLMGLTWLTLMGYLRISTHPSIFDRPLAPAEACQNIEALLALPQCQVLAEQPDFWEVYTGITGESAVRGNLVPDAHLAAILRQHDVNTLYTNDSDFRRFTFLDVRNPLA